jgi:hypothetical protein
MKWHFTVGIEAIIDIITVIMAAAGIITVAADIITAVADITTADVIVKLYLTQINA